MLSTLTKSAGVTKNNGLSITFDNIVIIIIIIMIVIIIIIKYQVAVRRGIVCLMGRKTSSALGGSLSRDDVSIKELVGGNH